VHESNNRSASTLLAKSPASPRSAGTVGLYTPGNLSFFLHHIPTPTFHRPPRDAVQRGHAHPCVQCRKQPQAVGDLCLGCDSSVARSNETRLRELDLRDPKADSRMYPTPATQPLPLTVLQLSPTSTVSGKVLNQSKSEKSSRFVPRATSSKPVKLTSAVWFHPTRGSYPADSSKP